MLAAKYMDQSFKKVTNFTASAMQMTWTTLKRMNNLIT